MRLFIDARMAFHSGIGRYLRNHLLVLLRDHPSISLDLVVQGALRKRWLQRYLETPTSAVTFRIQRLSHRSPLQFFRIPWPHGADLIWYPDFRLAPWTIAILPTKLRKKCIVSVHDLILLDPAPGFASWLKQIVATISLRICMRHAGAILCLSETMLAELNKKFPSARERIFLVPGGVITGSWMPLDANQKKQVRETLGLRRYLLTVGIEEDRKGHQHLPSILALLNQPELQLVVVGELPKRKVNKGRTWLDQFQSGALTAPVVYFGEVNEATLWKLYSAAEVFLFPSSKEGFGLPTLEAMASGTCVIAADIEVLREVCGSNAVFAPVLAGNGEVHRKWSEELRALLASPQRMKTMRETGREFVELNWRWERATSDLVELLRRLAQDQAHD